jgi:hypothetical protein
MKLLILAASLMLATPVSAQSFFPNLFGSRFCQLRQMGIDVAEARKIAMAEAWSQYRQPVYVDYKGTRTTLDVLDASRYVVNNCPEAAK